MRVFGTTLPPFGFVHFCERLPAECVPPAARAALRCQPERMSELDEINRHVNRIIQPATDQDLYGVDEHWTIPRDRGDCEDYALLKRQILIPRAGPRARC